MPNIHIVSLDGTTSKAEVLAAIGDKLHLGGPGGNHPVRPGEQAGWGLNWDALFDGLLNLHSGGIWGSSPAFEFPLRIVIADARRFAAEDPRAFAILKDLLEQTREAYSRTGRDFGFDIRL